MLFQGALESNSTLKRFLVPSGTRSNSRRNRAKCSLRQVSSAIAHNHQHSGNSACRASKWRKYSSIPAGVTVAVSSVCLPATTGYCIMVMTLW